VNGRSVFVRAPGPTENLRIGLLGGSFNPAHEGHLHLSRVALARLRLDYVWWLVSPQNPLKPGEGMADFAARLAHAREVARHPRVIATGIEDAIGTRYTIDTIARLKRRFPRAHFVWLMGSDNLVQIPLWRRWKEIFCALPAAVVTRPGSALSGRVGKAARRLPLYSGDAVFASRRPPALAILEARRSPISGTAIRAAGARTMAG